MKKIIMFVLSGLLFIGCYENETIHADYMEYGRIYDTTSTIFLNTIISSESC